VKIGDASSREIAFVLDVVNNTEDGLDEEQRDDDDAKDGMRVVEYITPHLGQFDTQPKSAKQGHNTE